MTSPLVLPDRVPISDVSDLDAAIRALGILTPDDAARLAAVEQASWVLVRCDGVGERWRCNRCGVRHSHFTTFCVPRPFQGLRDGLMAYWRNTAVPDADLSPEQRAARREMARGLGFRSGLPALADRHPETARLLGTAPGTVDLGAWVLGTIDPISIEDARKYAALINARARRPVVRIP